MNECYIIAGGPSVTSINFNKLKGKDIIVVNKAVLDFPTAKYFITLDFSFLKKIDKQIRKLKASKATKVFVANFTHPYLEEKDGRITDTRWNLIYKLNLFDMIIKSYNTEKFGMTFNDFRNGNNSGYCAIQFAIALGYKEINLIGFDLEVKHKTHYHDGYHQSTEQFKEKLEEYYVCLKEAILDLKSQESDINLYNCAKDGRLSNLLPYKEI